MTRGEGSKGTDKPLLLNLDNMLEAESIQDQRTMRNGRIQYLVQWAGVDPDTGSAWAPTWESKSSCTTELIQDWEKRKKEDIALVGRWIKKEEEERDSGKRKRDSLAVGDVKKARVGEEDVPTGDAHGQPHGQHQHPQAPAEPTSEPVAPPPTASRATTTISLSNNPPQSGPGPTTASHRAATSPSRPVLPPPSDGTNTQATQATQNTQASKSTQNDPIDDFSSPPRGPEDVPSQEDSQADSAPREESSHQPVVDELPLPQTPDGPTVNELLEKLDAQAKLVESLTTKLQRAKEKHETLAEENSFFQSQYQIASNSAVAEVRRVNELQAQLEKVKNQLSIGLKQRDMHYDAIKTKRATEETRLRGQMNILLEQARRTDDAVRRKAAAHDRLKEENERLATQNYDLRTKCSQLQERNEELVDFTSTLRARMMGAVVDNEESDSEGDAEDDVTDASSPLVPKSDPLGLGYTGGLSSHGFTSSQIMPSERQIGGVGVDMGQRTSGPDGEVIEGGSAFLCKWDDGNPCELAFDTHADLAEHSRGHVF